MKFLLTTVLCLVFTFKSFSQHKNELHCSQVHLGSFSKIDQIFGIYNINRYKSDDGKIVQTEHVVKSKLKIEFIINWVDDCTCELRFSKVLENGIGHDFETMLKDVVRTEKISEFTYNESNAIVGYKLKATSNQHNEFHEENIKIE
jgi:hypothetical protein